MAKLFFFGLYFFVVASGDATRCFECQNIPYPRACAHLAVCSSDEHCYTEQIVTSGGNIVYNTGCVHNQRCSVVRELVGKRSSNITIRSKYDISTCLECCHGDLCNNQGCGTKALAADQRGPYCFQCDSVLDPKDCRSTAVCVQNEVCLLYSPIEFAGLPETIYRSTCGKKSECDVLLQTVNSNRCSPTCCDADFCNDKCGIFLYNNMTHPIQTTVQPSGITTPRSTYSTQYSQGTTTVTVETSKIPLSSSTVPPRPCDTSGGYKHIHNSEADLCVHIVLHHYGWNESRAHCKNEGGDLVVLDTHEKALLLRKFLAGDSHYDHEAYWIGAKNFQNPDHYSWVNQLPINSSEADWDNGQPNDHDNDRSTLCVYMLRSHHDHHNYQWHDRYCSKEVNYICERK